MTISQQLAALGLDDAKGALARAQQDRTFTDEQRAGLRAAVTARVTALMAGGRRVDTGAVEDEERTKLNAELLTKAREAAHAAYRTIDTLKPKLDAIQRTARGPAALPPVVSEIERKSMMSLELSAVEPLRLILRELRGLRLRQDVGPLALDEKLTALEAGERAKDAEVTNFLEPLIERELASAVPMMGVDPLGKITAHKARIARLERVRDSRLTDDDRKALTEAAAAVKSLTSAATMDEFDWNNVERQRSIVPNSIEVLAGVRA